MTIRTTFWQWLLRRPRPRPTNGVYEVHPFRGWQVDDGIRERTPEQE